MLYQNDNIHNGSLRSLFIWYDYFMGKLAKQKQIRKLKFVFYKELFLAGLAIVSVYLVFYEYLWPVSESTRLAIEAFELLVSCVFLTDFCILLTRSPNKRLFLSKNWYMLLASIPILNSWAELLRGLRLLGLVRLVRAGEHLTYALRAAKR